MSTIGFVVWGIRNGFKNNWLAANVDINVYKHLTDDMRQICNSTIDKFFSIEKLQDYTLLSIINPNTIDHVQRKAYIALSIVIPNGYFLKGDVIGILHTMMHTYEVKQGNAMVNMVNVEDMKIHLQQLQLIKNPNTVPHTRTKIGLFSYIDTSEINSHFQDPSIYEFKKVFFISGQNLALEKMHDIQKVNEFTKPLFLTVSDFDPKFFQVTINNQPITTAKSSINKGDLIQFVELKTKRVKQLQVGTNDVWVSLLEIFPPITFSSHKPKSTNRPKLISIGVFFVGVLVIGFYFFMKDSGSQDITNDNGSTSSTNHKPDTAIYDFEILKLNNLPQLDDSISFSIYQLSNNSIAIGSVKSKKPELEITKLRASVDTFIFVKYKINNNLKSMKIPVEFKIPKVYKIKPEEGLSTIVERFNIKKDSIMNWNNIQDENKIKAGDTLSLKPEPKVEIQQVQTPNTNPGIVEPTPKTETPKQTQQPAPAAEKPPKTNANDQTQLKKEVDKLIKELKQLGVEITRFEDTKNNCQDQDCLKSLIEKMKKEKQKI